MINTIQMAKRYQTQPSKLLGIEYDYLAYMVDEFALYLENELTDTKTGQVKWNKIKYEGEKDTSNKDFMEHIIKMKAGV